MSVRNPKTEYAMNDVHIHIHMILATINVISRVEN